MRIRAGQIGAQMGSRNWRVEVFDLIRIRALYHITTNGIYKMLPSLIIPFIWTIRHSCGENLDTMNSTMLTPT